MPLPPPPPPPPPPPGSSSSIMKKGPSAKMQQQQSSAQPPLHPPRPPLVNRGGSDGSRGTSKSNSNNIAFKDLVRSSQQQQKHQQQPSQHTISVDTVVSSQFENEAETHILAALEIEERDQSNLLGEGIDITGGMDDYSDDEEDDDNLFPGGEASGGGGGRERTYSTDSFLKRVHMQNDQPQYHYEVESSPSISTSPAASQQQHKRYLSSTKGSGYLPSVPDDAVLYDYLERSDLDHDKDSSFLESVHPSKDGGGEEDDTNIDSKGESKGDGAASGGDETANTKTTTNATENVNTMAKRLHQLQRRNSMFSRRMSSSSASASATSSTEFLSNNSGGDNAQDKLIDALTSVDSSSRGWFSKMRYEWNLLIVPKLPTFRRHISRVLFFLVFPCLAVAAVLFYMFDNPMAGNTGTSISWWIIFVGARQAITMGLTWVGQVFWVEILALRSRLFNTIVGPYVSLAIIQSSGWPYNICFWAVLDFILLFGNYPFPRHWLFWQNKLDIFNANNPVNGVVNSNGYLRLLFTCIFVGIAASLKRLFLAVYLGRRTVAHFNAEMEKVFAKMILIGEIAALAKEIENKHEGFRGTYNPDDEEKMVRFREIILNDSCSSADGSPKRSSPSRPGGRKVLDEPGESKGDTPEPSQGAKKIDQPGEESPDTRASRQRQSSFLDSSTSEGAGKPVYSSSSNVKLMNLLEEWEEPELISGSKAVATVKDLVNFRKAVSYMDDKYPFSHAFGPANTRELTISSAQTVYDRLMLAAGDNQVLPFSTLAVLATAPDGSLMDVRIKSLIRLLRPDRQGNLTKLDFVKSIDEVYKQQRLLRASISSSNRIDNAFEKIVNCFFYFFLAIIAFTILGWANVWTVFLSFNTFFLGFSFLFGAAASNYFEGLLLIFVRRPYDIGDRIATSNPKSDTSPDGSSTWYVDNVTLFTTTVRFATTNEVATYSNGSIAQLRIINANRSPKGIVSVLIKFGLETPFNKVTVFRAAVENFIKARPREWIALSGFRATSVEADFGYVEYKIIAQHREKWQNIGPILQSKADLSSFILEVTKKLDMKYESPPMPVNLSATGSMNIRGLFADDGDVEPQSGLRDVNVSADDLQDVANLFEVRKD